MKSLRKLIFCVFLVGLAYVAGNLLMGRTEGYTGLTNVEIDENLIVADTVSHLEKIVDYATTSTARTITAAEAAKHYTFVMGESGNDPVTFNLPAAVTGMEVTFIDNDATAAADLTINPDDSDTIDGGNAGVSFNCTTDAVGQSCTLRAVSAVNWVPVAIRGTWAAGS